MARLSNAQRRLVCVQAQALAQAGSPASDYWAGKAEGVEAAMKTVWPNERWRMVALAARMARRYGKRP